MSINKLFTIFASAFVMFIVWVIFLANTGQSSILFSVAANIPYGDKVGHFFLIGTLTFLVTMSLKLKTISVGGFRPYLGAVIISIAVFIEELSQYFIPNRTLDMTDLFADFLGVVVVCFILKKLEAKSSALPMD